MFFDGFKAIEAIGGVYPNGISMDKDERLACAAVAITCVIMTTSSILRDWTGGTAESQPVKISAHF